MSGQHWDGKDTRSKGCREFFKNYSFGPFMQLNHVKVEGPSGQALFEAASNYIYVETL